MTVKKSTAVLRVGEFEPTFADELATRYEIPTLPDGPRRAQFLAEHATDVRVVETSGRPGVGADTIRALPNLEAIVNYGAGVDAIDLEAAKRRGVGVSNTPDVLSDTVADTALGLILMTLRRFGAADRYVRAGRWARDGQSLRQGRQRSAGRDHWPGPDRFGHREPAAAIRLCHRVSQPPPD